MHDLAGIKISSNKNTIVHIDRYKGDIIVWRVQLQGREHYNYDIMCYSY